MISSSPRKDTVSSGAPGETWLFALAARPREQCLGRVPESRQPAEHRFGTTFLRRCASHMDDMPDLCQSNVTLRLQGKEPSYCRWPASPSARRNPFLFSNGFRTPGICTRLMYCPKHVWSP